MRYLVFLFSFLWSSLLPAQGDLVSKLDELSEHIHEVQVKEDRYLQSLSWDKDAPYKLSLRVVEIDKKGREESLTYQFNLGLLDSKLVRWEDGKDRISLLLSSGREAVFKVMENGEFDGFDKEAVILADGVDNARRLEEMIEEIIPLSRDLWKEKAVLPEDLEGLKSWVGKRVEEVRVDDRTVFQVWEADNAHPCRVRLEQSLSDKGDTYRYHWNMADIYPPSIEVDVRKKEIAVELGVRNNDKYISVVENGESANFENKMVLFVSEVDDAQILAQALRELAKLAAEKQKELTPRYADKEKALAELRTLIGEVQHSEGVIRQSVEGSCMLTCRQSVSDEKKSDDYVYEFFIGDLERGSAEIVVKGDRLFVEVSIRNKKDLIAVMLNGEQENYENELAFAVSTLPEAKQLRQCLNALVDACPEEVQPRAWPWFQEAVENGATHDLEISQEVKKVEDQACKWELSVREAGGKKEEAYEFNLYDISVSALDLEVKGKEVFVTVMTRNKQEIIKNYTDREKLGYVDEFSFWVQSIPDGKAVVATLKALIEGCEQ